MIPKRIIQTGPPNPPLLLESAMVTVKLLHPDFEYRFFDDAAVEKFLATSYPDYVEDFQSFRYRIQRYDFFRYVAVYHFGGFYLDLDVFLARNLTALLPSQCVFPFEELAEAPYFGSQLEMDWQIGNYAFGAEAGHPFLAAAIENCRKARRDPQWVRPMMRGIPPSLKSDFYVLNTTGPGLLSRTLAENPELAEGVDVLFPGDVCDPAKWHQFGEFGVHHMAGSWRGPSSYLSRYLTRAWGVWNQRRVLAQGRARGATRPRRITTCPTVNG